MPNIKSQIKRVEISAKEKLSNNSKRTKVKNTIKKFTAAVEANDLTLAQSLYTETISTLDRAYYDGIYHKNTVARKKSSVAKLLNTIKN